MLVDSRSKFLDRAAQVIAADKADGKKLVKERFEGYSQQELRLAQLKALRIRYVIKKPLGRLRLRGYSCFRALL